MLFTAITTVELVNVRDALTRLILTCDALWLCGPCSVLATDSEAATGALCVYLHSFNAAYASSGYAVGGLALEYKACSVPGLCSSQSLPHDKVVRSWAH